MLLVATQGWLIVELPLMLLLIGQQQLLQHTTVYTVAIDALSPCYM